MVLYFTVIKSFKNIIFNYIWWQNELRHFALKVAFWHLTDFKRGKYSFSTPHPSMQSCAAVRATYRNQQTRPLLWVRGWGGVWILLFSEVILFEYNVSSILLPIVVISRTFMYVNFYSSLHHMKSCVWVFLLVSLFLFCCFYFTSFRKTCDLTIIMLLLGKWSITENSTVISNKMWVFCSIQASDNWNRRHYRYSTKEKTYKISYWWVDSQPATGNSILVGKIFSYAQYIYMLQVKIKLRLKFVT